MPSAAPNRLPAIDAIKAIASQLIVLHHLALYGPMSEAVDAAAPRFMDALRDYALLAVPAFLVVGGFLAARALLPRAAETGWRALPYRLWSRYRRLMQPYIVALFCAILCAWLARGLAPHPDLPAAPTWPQVIAHLLLLQDIVGVDALSAGVWYVAIDFQLYALLLLLLAGFRRREPFLVACALLFAASLFWINRHAEFDMWAPYFFAAYGLGIFAERLTTRGHTAEAIALIAVLVAAALLVEWRERILVAGATAVLLLWSRGGRLAPRWMSHPSIGFLGRISYALFLIHYPISVLVGAIVARFWPGDVAINALGLLATWLASIAAAALLYRWTEKPGGGVSPRLTFAA